MLPESSLMLEGEVGWRKVAVRNLSEHKALVAIQE